MICSLGVVHCLLLLLSRYWKELFEASLRICSVRCRFVFCVSYDGFLTF
nr:MAG TPA: hypothetical protein [Caudoviricetes sp.]